MKLEEDVVWHEFGHLFSYKLVEKLDFKTRKIIKLSLVRDEYKNPFIKSDCIDFIRLKDESWNKYQKRLKTNLKHNGFYFQSIIKLMGAIFQLENMIGKPKKSDFKKIFTNLYGNVSSEDFKGHAGDDFKDVKLYLMDYDGNLKYKDMRAFALGLHSALDSQNIFKLLKESVGHFNQNYNGRHLKGDDLLRNELDSIGRIIDQSNLVKFIKIEIEKLDEKKGS